MIKNALRSAGISVGMVAGLALAGASQAQAGVSFGGTFPLPHGVISIGIGDPYFSVGAFVPVGYRVCARDGYGYGFMYRDSWIPVQRYGARWRVCARPWYDDVYYNDVYYGGSYYTGRYSPRYHRSYHGDTYAHRSYDRDRWNGHRDQRWSDDRHRWNRDRDRNERWNHRGNDRSHRDDDRRSGNHDRNGHRDRRHDDGDRH